ncbi:LCP family protein [Aneurinibacillus uraniidurans]|uniref:LCP family protein n=1 Tax=Aneurinibacillus uraniidurans TaxID=2966586 RepID=UPI00234B9355|nr:LCP family protein [Aneurinibacillus sp. B1]WCN37535.1 LCP family protein [Aneurinibacillus sp. B1]
MKIIRIIKILFLTLVLVVVGGGAYYAYSFYSFTSKIHNPAAATSLPEWTGTERVNVLLLGVDKREKEETTRSDSMMIASIDPTTKKAHLFSVLRDSWVDIPGHRKNRINSAYELGGPELTAETVEELTGMPIQYYVVTDFQGFEKVVDALGGIDMYVEKDMEYYLYEDHGYYDIVLKKGQQHLDGRKALQYVRFRHDKMGDFTRTERQRNFMKAMAEKAKSSTSLLRIPSVLEAVSPYVTTNMTSSDMLRLANLGYKIDWSTVESDQIPPANILREKRVNGAQVIDPRKERTQKYLRELLNGETGNEEQTKNQ